MKDKSGKANLKGKVVLVYEQLLRGEDPGKFDPNFWHEFFLLWPNTSTFETLISELPEKNLVKLTPIIHTVFIRCISAIKDTESIRTVNALQTLCSLIKSVGCKENIGSGFAFVELLMGFDHATVLMQALIERISDFIIGVYPSSLKTMCFRLLLVLLTITENVSENIFLEYLMINSVFESIIQILANQMTRKVYGRESLVILSILINYRKYESHNQYVVKLSILDNELALNGYSQVIAAVLSKYNRALVVAVASREQWNQKIQENIDSSESSNGLLSSITNMVGNMFITHDTSHPETIVKTNDSMLLAMYEAVHLNRNFITTLTNLSTEFKDVSSSTALGEDSTETQLESELECTTNLLVAFLTFSSIVMQDLKCSKNHNATKLSMIILTCIAEDQYANALMHDVNMTFRVPLFLAPMRHRKCGFELQPPSRPLACAVLDLCLEFIRSHLMRSFPAELYLYVEEHLESCTESYVTKRNVKSDCSILGESFLMVVNLMNLFITFGDTFLPTPSIYDELYYEMIRNLSVFETVYNIALKYSGSDGDTQLKQSAIRLCNSLVNIRAIVNHLQPKLNDFEGKTLTEQQVLEIVRQNYDTLTLKLQENLDAFEKYNEQPRESKFFVQLLKSIVIQNKHKLHGQLDHQIVMSEFSVIK